MCPRMQQSRVHLTRIIIWTHFNEPAVVVNWDDIKREKQSYYRNSLIRNRNRIIATLLIRNRAFNLSF
jgi:hypothetical protein